MTGPVSIFERMSRHARVGQLVDLLDRSAMCRMPCGEQLRFRNFLLQLSGARPRLEPLPLPPAPPDTLEAIPTRRKRKAR